MKKILVVAIAAIMAIGAAVYAANGSCCCGDACRCTPDAQCCCDCK